MFPRASESSCGERAAGWRELCLADTRWLNHGGATQVTLGMAVSATLSEPMAPVSVTRTSFPLRDPSSPLGSMSRPMKRKRVSEPLPGPVSFGGRSGRRGDQSFCSDSRRQTTFGSCAAPLAAEVPSDLILATCLCGYARFPRGELALRT